MLWCSYVAWFSEISLTFLLSIYKKPDTELAKFTGFFFLHIELDLENDLLPFSISILRTMGQGDEIVNALRVNIPRIVPFQITDQPMATTERDTRKQIYI